MNPGGWQKVFQYKGKKVISNLGTHKMRPKTSEIDIVIDLSLQGIKMR